MGGLEVARLLIPVFGEDEIQYRIVFENIGFPIVIERD